MTVPITVAIPVGPLPRHRAHLDECLFSVMAQTVAPDEILVVDPIPGAYYPPPITVAWDGALTIADAFNTAVTQARNELVFFLGSDDLIYPTCLEQCWRAWLRHQDSLGWYYVAVRDSSGYQQNVPCLAAMVTKDLFAHSGGLKSEFAPHASCEIEYIDRLIRNPALGCTYKVSEDVLYFWKKH